MKTLEKLIQHLIDFNEKVEDLRSCKQFIAFFNENRQVKTKLSNFPEDIEKKGPEFEAISAYMLHFRFFIQSREMTSFQKMGEEIYLKLGDLNDFKTEQREFNLLRKQFNKVLDSPSGFDIHFDNSGKFIGLGISDPGEVGVSNRDLLDAFLNGKYAHINSLNGRLLYKRIASDSFNLAVAEYFIVGILLHLTKYIFKVEELNNQVITKLKQIAKLA
jgi:hypothetical protein